MFFIEGQPQMIKVVQSTPGKALSQLVKNSFSGTPVKTVFKTATSQESGQVGNFYFFKLAFTIMKKFLFEKLIKIFQKLRIENLFGYTVIDQFLSIYVFSKLK